MLSMSENPTLKTIFAKQRPNYKEHQEIVAYLDSLDWTRPPDLYALVLTIMGKFKVGESVARDHCILHSNY